MIGKHHHIPYSDNPNVIVLSIQFSGTHFLCDLIRCRHTHVNKANSLDGKLIVCPLRHPVKLWESWCNRAYVKRPDKYIVPAQQFAERWRQLEALDRARTILYVPLDHPSREQAIGRLSDTLGWELRPDWNNRPAHIEHKIREPWKPELDFIFNLPMVTMYSSLKKDPAQAYAQAGPIARCR